MLHWGHTLPPSVTKQDQNDQMRFELSKGFKTGFAKLCAKLCTQICVLNCVQNYVHNYVLKYVPNCVPNCVQSYVHNYVCANFPVITVCKLCVEYLSLIQHIHI